MAINATMTNLAVLAAFRAESPQVGAFRLMP
jgi:hypothetical protein